MEIEVLLELIELILTRKSVDKDFLQNLIEKNFVVDEETLFIATQMRQIELVSFVLKSGVKPTLESFQYAAEHEFFELCRLFVEFGSRKILSTPELEVELVTNLTNGQLRNFENLINRGIDPTTDDNYAIKNASEWGHTEVVSLLLKHGTDSIAKNDVLQTASWRGYFDIVQLLLDNGADLTYISNHAIRIASENGHLEIVRLLLANGADPTAEDNCAIKMASHNGWIKVVKLLLKNNSKYKVDPTAGDNYAIRWASGHNRSKITTLLEEYGASF